MILLLSECITHFDTLIFNTHFRIICQLQHIKIFLEYYWDHIEYLNQFVNKLHCLMLSFLINDMDIISIYLYIH